MSYVLYFAECFGAAIPTTVLIYFVAYLFKRKKLELNTAKVLLSLLLVVIATTITRFFATVLFGVPQYIDVVNNNNMWLLFSFGFPLIYTLLIFEKERQI